MGQPATWDMGHPYREMSQMSHLATWLRDMSGTSPCQCLRHIPRWLTPGNGWNHRTAGRPPDCPALPPGCVRCVVRFAVVRGSMASRFVASSSTIRIVARDPLEANRRCSSPVAAEAPRARGR
jgi:hypothetical protein